MALLIPIFALLAAWTILLYGFWQYKRSQALKPYTPKRERARGICPRSFPKTPTGLQARPGTQRPRAPARNARSL